MNSLDFLLNSISFYKHLLKLFGAFFFNNFDITVTSQLRAQVILTYVVPYLGSILILDTCILVKQFPLLIIFIIFASCFALHFSGFLFLYKQKFRSIFAILFLKFLKIQIIFGDTYLLLIFKNKKHK